MKRIVLLLIALCLAVSGSVLPAAAEEPHLEGDPWINSNIYGCWPAERPAPEEQYELYVNYDAYMEALAKGDSADANNFLDSENTLLENIQELCTNPEKTDAASQCLRMLYGFYTDRESIEKEGFASLMAYVDRVKAVKSLDELTALMQEKGFLFKMPFLGYEVQSTSKEPKQYELMISRTFCLEDVVPEEDGETDSFAEAEKDLEGARKKLVRMQYTEEEAAQLAEKIAEIESFIITDYTNTDWEDELHNKPALSLQDIRELCPPAAALLEGQCLVPRDGETQEVYQWEFPDMAGFRQIYREENLEALKAMVALNLYDFAREHLGHEAFPEEEADGNPMAALRHIPQILIGQAYQNNYIPQERLGEYYQLVQDIREAMQARIELSTWTSPETKEKALEKLAKMTAAPLLDPVEYDYELLLTGLRSCTCLLEAAAQNTLFWQTCDMSYIGNDFIPGNKRFGTSDLFKVSGFYTPDHNAFYITLGALTGKVYNDTSRETLLGSIGAHIAHEISHGYDNVGMTYDADGMTNMICTEEEMQVYMNKANAIADRVSKIMLLDDLSVPGSQLLGEVIADMQGVRLVLDIAKQDANFDYDAFFRAFAQFYCNYHADRDSFASTYSGEVHPAPFVRVNFSLQSMDEFYATYPSVVEGTPMYLPPEERVLVW